MYAAYCYICVSCVHSCMFVLMSRHFVVSQVCVQCTAVYVLLYMCPVYCYVCPHVSQCVLCTALYALLYRCLYALLYRCMYCAICTAISVTQIHVLCSALYALLYRCPVHCYMCVRMYLRCSCLCPHRRCACNAYAMLPEFNKALLRLYSLIRRS